MKTEQKTNSNEIKPVLSAKEERNEIFKSLKVKLELLEKATVQQAG